jgi:uncharacterized membrane protein YgcG
MRYIYTLTLSILIAIGLVSILSPVTFADVQDFSFESYSADYYLRKDDAGRSALRTRETLVATFPATNQNHGIERAIPNSYNGHNVRLQIQSVTGHDGKALPYTTYQSNDNTVVRVGSAGEYVHGKQIYVLVYEVHDATRTVSGHDELFWDTNGTAWSQAFAHIEARLHLPKDIAAAYTKRVRCYEGAVGSNTACSVGTQVYNNETVLSFTATRPMAAGENVSFVTAFKANTFKPYQKTFWERWMPLLLTGFILANGAIFVIISIFAVRIWRRYGRPPAGKGTIVPEYIPPKNTSLLIAGAVMKKHAAAPSALLIEWAVKRYINIYEIEKSSGFFGKKRTYEIEQIALPATLSTTEQQVARAVFGTDYSARRVRFEDIRSVFATLLPSLQKSVALQANAEGIYADRTVICKKYYRRGGVCVVLGLLLLSPGLCIGGCIIVVTASQLRPLTAKGVMLRDYILGLSTYMKLAEADRLRMLQSPQGARKTSVDIHDTRQLIHVHENLLPFAVLLGIEKEWLTSFATLYEQPPEWYAGNWSSFNAGVFAASLSSFTTATSTAFAPASSSSASGFSGGSSGGGGGGGGGGGW